MALIRTDKFGGVENEEAMAGFQTGDMIKVRGYCQQQSLSDCIGRLVINDKYVPGRISLSPYTFHYSGERQEEAVCRVLKAENMSVAELRDNELLPNDKHPLLAWMQIELKEGKFVLEKIVLK